MVFLLKNSQKFQTLEVLGKTGGVLGKKLEIFCQNWLIWQVWFTVSLKLCFHSRILKMFRFWILSEKYSEVFKNAKVQGKLSASRNVLMLKGSQTFKFGFFEKKDVFCSKKSLIVAKKC